MDNSKEYIKDITQKILKVSKKRKKIVLPLFLLGALLIFNFFYFKFHNKFIDKNKFTKIKSRSTSNIVKNKNDINSIVSLSPSITETLFFYGYGDRLIGRTDYCITPNEAKNIPSMGSMTNPNVEMIFFENPKYIIGQTHVNIAREKMFRSIGIEVLTLKTPKTVKEILDGHKFIVSNLEKNSEEKVLIAKLNEIKEIEEIVKKIMEKSKEIKKRPKIYYSLGGGNTEYTSGKGSFIDDIITIAGGDNIVKEKGWSFSLEGLIYSQPDIIILSKSRYNAMVKDSKYSELEALKDKKRIIFAEEEEITLPTPKLLIETLPRIQRAILDYNI